MQRIKNIPVESNTEQVLTDTSFSDGITKILLIDGYTASGKSTCLGLFQNILGVDFYYIPKYSTRLSRVDENNGEIFCETIFLSEEEFKKKNISHVYTKVGIHYGMNLVDIGYYFNKKKKIFIIANEFFRKKNSRII